MRTKTALILVAHPDDEVIGVGGTILKLQKEYGYNVFVNVMSYSPSVTKWESFCKSSQILNFQYDYPFDKENFIPNQLDKLGANTIAIYISEIIDRIKPEIVFTHHSGDLHQDHRAVFEATLIATRSYPEQIVKKVFTFETLSSTDWAFGQFNKFEPNVYLDISEYYNEKLEAIRAYGEEIISLKNNHTRSIQGIQNKDTLNGFKVGLKKVECFNLIRSIDML